MTLTQTPAQTVDRLLDAICAGAGVPDELFTEDALLDATVPGWRFKRRGAAAVADQYSGWFADAAELEEVERRPFEGGEALSYLLTWVERGVPHAAHHCHLLLITDDGRIARDRFFCGGRWDAGRLAEMAVAGDAG